MKIEWKVSHRDEDFMLIIEQVEELVYSTLRVPVWRVVEGPQWPYRGRFVRDENLPPDLREVFGKWMLGSAAPFLSGAYDHDFRDFMSRRGRGWSGDFSEVVKRYFR